MCQLKHVSRNRNDLGGMSAAGKVFPARSSLPGVLLACTLTVVPAFADRGPALSGLAAVADTASTVDTNSAGMMLLEVPELEFGFLGSYSESTFEIRSTNVPGSGRDESSGGMFIPARRRPATRASTTSSSQNHFRISA